MVFQNKCVPDGTFYEMVLYIDDLARARRSGNIFRHTSMSRNVAAVSCSG